MLTEEVDWFDERRSYARTSSGQFLADFLGYGEPIFAFAVEDITSDSRPLGVANTLWNFCVVAQDAKLSTLAHELGHMCGLLHRSNASNLMTPNRTDDRLTRWQISVIRNSRFVTFSALDRRSYLFRPAEINRELPNKPLNPTAACSGRRLEQFPIFGNRGGFPAR